MAKTGRINFGGGGGIDPDELNALPEHVLTGKSFGGSGSDEPQTGNMPNRGAVTQALNAGGSYTIPNGYHNGSGKITANSLASQTSATATAGYIYNGKTAWVNGSKITGNMTVGSILNFSAAAYSTTQILLKWQNPYAATGKPFSGVFINYSTGGYPGMWGGTRIYTGAGNNTASGGWSQVIVNMPAAGTGYYFSCNTYCTCSAGDFYGNTLNAYAATSAHGSQTFTTSGIFTVPSNIRLIDIFCVGAGGISSRSTGSTSSLRVALGGAGGYTATSKGISVTPGATYSVVVGASASSVVAPSSKMQSGSSSFGNILTANGGWGGDYCTSTSTHNGHDGGSGSPAYWGLQSGAVISGSQTPGTDGSDGGSIHYWYDSNDNGYVEGTVYGGKGQGRTTRAFGEASGTLYSSAGGNGGAANGSPNTGNGAQGRSIRSSWWATGGSGIVIVRW